MPVWIYVEVYSITKANRSPEQLITLFNHRGAVTFPELQEALGNASRATTFRYLRQTHYLRSYNHNGRYYTHRDPAMFNRFGLYSQGGIFFSREGSLGNTLKRLIQESESGWTHRELSDLLCVRVQVPLLEAVRQEKIEREKVGGFYLYLHHDPTIGRRQRQVHQQRINSQKIRDSRVTTEPEHTVIIQVLLILIRYPASRPAEVTRRLRGHSPPIPIEQVVSIFTQYDLETIGKKGGSTIS